MKRRTLFSGLLVLAALPSHSQQPQPVYLPYSEQQAKVEQRLWNAPVWKTPYQPTLSDDQKIAGLSKLWAEAKYAFVYFDKVPKLSWDSLYLATIPKVKAAPTTLAYYQVLQEMCAQLRDGHTNVSFPKELRSELRERPPLRTALVEDKVLITEVRSETLRQQGLAPGQEIVAVDGTPVHEHARSRAALQSASTPQDLELSIYTSALLTGSASQPLALTLRDAKGRSLQKTIARSGYTDKAPEWPVMEFQLLPGNVGYVALNGFDDPNLTKLFADVFPKLSQTNALILDVRRNGGGNSDIGYDVLSYLTDQPFHTSKWMARNYVPPFRPWGVPPQWISAPESPTKPKGGTPYTKPVVVLTSAATFSAAEDFAVAFDAMKRGLIVGEATGGSTGQPVSFPLPGGGAARICSKRDTYPDGKEFVGVGVQPQIVVRPTVRDVRSGRDTVLEAALKAVKTQTKR